jgi:hypothetical protein
MDPIHPIIPVTPHLLPVLPSPKIGIVEREAPHDPPDRRGRKRPASPASAGADDGPDAVVQDDEDDGLGHVDLTA